MTEKIFRRNDLQVSLNAAALLHNVETLQSCCKDTVKFCAVVKANAYGHGLSSIVDILAQAQVDWFAVASVYEAFHIVEQVKMRPILVLEPLNSGVPAEAIMQCAQRGIQCTVSSKEAAEYIEAVFGEHHPKLKVHVNIDTGMSRGGVGIPLIQPLLEFISTSKSMELVGVYTHFANADEEDLSFAREQLDLFNGVLKKQKGYIHDDVMIHAANSPATMKLPEAHFDMVRCGISMYGYSTIEIPPVELRPILKLTSPIIYINTIEKGRTVGYGRTFTAKRTTKIGILPIGYSDGFWRFFSNQAKLIVEDKIVPVIGRVTMNQTILDITDVPNVQIGQSITLIDDKLDSLCGVYALAKSSGTICYEILTNIPAWASVS